MRLKVHNIKQKSLVLMGETLQFFFGVTSHFKSAMYKIQYEGNDLRAECSYKKVQNGAFLLKVTGHSKKNVGFPPSVQDFFVV